VARHSSLQLHSAGRTWMMRVVGIAMIGVCGYLIFEFGRIQADYNIVDVSAERQGYENRIAELENEIITLKQEVALLETHRDIDREAYKGVERSLTTLQVKIQEQKDAIAFYRGIVSPQDGKSGLRVQDLHVTRGNAEHEYNLRVVLVQSMQHDRKVSGNVSLSIEGSQGGVETSYTYSQLQSESEDKDWVYSFRYFQDFDRTLMLPDGFTPERIKIEVNSKTKSVSSVEESFSWTTSLG
jgi:hypothetical protein